MHVTYIYSPSLLIHLSFCASYHMALMLPGLPSFRRWVRALNELQLWDQKRREE